MRWKWLIICGRVDVRKPPLRVWESSGTFEALRVRRLRNELSSKLCILHALLLVMLLCNFRPLFSSPPPCSLFLSRAALIFLVEIFFFLLIPSLTDWPFSFTFAMFSTLAFPSSWAENRSSKALSFFGQMSLCLKYLSQRYPAELEHCPSASAEPNKVSSLVLWRVIKMDIALPRRPDAEIVGRYSHCTILFNVFHLSFLPSNTKIYAHT